jgi:hypothetical protein
MLARLQPCFVREDLPVTLLPVNDANNKEWCVLSAIRNMLRTANGVVVLIIIIECQICRGVENLSVRCMSYYSVCLPVAPFMDELRLENDTLRQRVVCCRVKHLLYCSTSSSLHFEMKGLSLRHCIMPSNHSLWSLQVHYHCSSVMDMAVYVSFIGFECVGALPEEV